MEQSAATEDIVLDQVSAHRPSMRSELLYQYKKRASGILHLGAHLGQEASEYASLGKSVVWVEAMPEVYGQLAKNLQSFPGQRALCALLADEDGAEKIFYVSNNSDGVSSSVFPFGDFGSGSSSLWPELGLAMVDQMTLRTWRLDTLLRRNDIYAQNFDFWVVDLQGAELLMLKGSGDLLKSCRALYVEVSTVEVYEGGVLWPDLAAWLDRHGFMPLWQPESKHDDVLFVRCSGFEKVVAEFHSDEYLRHNQRRLEHLASLRLPLHGKSVLEVGAGIGDHTGFFLDRGCRVHVTDARPENLSILRERLGGVQKVEIGSLDMDYPIPMGRRFSVVYCYGALYHLQRPEQAIRFLAEHCDGMLLLETCVSPGDGAEINLIEEPSEQFTQAVHGKGCRPTRQWVWDALQSEFPFVYATRTQPAHDQFPLNWENLSPAPGKLTRCVFIASRTDLAEKNGMLLRELPQRYGRN